MDPYLAQIIMWAGNFAPLGWKYCNGALLPISQYEALFALIGTAYGGDGVTTFGLPDLRGRTPVGVGQGLGLSTWAQGQIGGTESKTLTTSNLPQHTHQVQPSASIAVSTSSGTLHAAASTNDSMLAASNQRNNQFIPAAAAGNIVALNAYTPAAQTTSVGSSVPFEAFQPSLAINFIICVEGIFPSRN